MAAGVFVDAVRNKQHALRSKQAPPETEPVSHLAFLCISRTAFCLLRIAHYASPVHTPCFRANPAWYNHPQLAPLVPGVYFAIFPFGTLTYITKSLERFSMNTLTDTQKIIIVGVIAFVVGFGACYVWLSGVKGVNMIKNDNGKATSTAVTTGTGSTSNDSPLNKAGLLVKDQKPGSEVVVAMAHFDEPGWVVVYENNDGVLGRILGAQLFDKGEHPGVVSLLRPTIVGSTYTVVASTDDGDRRFDLSNDMPIKDAEGAMIMVRFLATDNPVNN